MPTYALGQGPTGGSTGGGGPTGGNTGASTTTTLKNPLAVATMEEFLIKVLQAVQMVLYPIIVIAVMYAGFLFITAQGNVAKITKAKQALMWVLIGAGIILGAEIIARAVQETITNL